MQRMQHAEVPVDLRVEERLRQVEPEREQAHQVARQRFHRRDIAGEQRRQRGRPLGPDVRVVEQPRARELRILRARHRGAAGGHDLTQVGRGLDAPAARQGAGLGRCVTAQQHAGRRAVARLLVGRQVEERQRDRAHVVDQRRRHAMADHLEEADGLAGLRHHLADRAPPRRVGGVEARNVDRRNLAHGSILCVAIG
jgi:hypothetical protein